MHNDELTSLSGSIIEEYRKITKTNYNPTISEYLDIRSQAIKEYEFIEPDFESNVEKNMDLGKSSFDIGNKAINNSTERNISQSYDNSFHQNENPNHSYSENIQNNTNFTNNNSFETNDSNLSDFEMLKRIKDPWN